MKDDAVYLRHMLEAANRILEYTREGEAAFLERTLLQDGVIRNFEVFGEAAKRVSDRTKLQLPGVPWRLVAGFRDILIHQYEGVDLGLVWRRVKNDLEPAAGQIRDYLERTST